MDFSHLKKLLLVALFTSGILSNSAMASYVSDGSRGIFHTLVDATLDLRYPSVFPQFSNIYIDAETRITKRTPGMISGAQLIGRNRGLSAKKSNSQGRIRVDGGKSKVAGRRALPVPVVLQPRPIINWQTFNLDGSGSVNFSNGGDLSLSQPSSRVGGGVNLIGGSISLRAPAGGNGNIITSSNGAVSSLAGVSPLELAPVPLPAASILLGSGLLGLLSFGAGRRRR